MGRILNTLHNPNQPGGFFWLLGTGITAQNLIFLNMKCEHGEDEKKGRIFEWCESMKLFMSIGCQPLESFLKPTDIQLTNGASSKGGNLATTSLPQNIPKLPPRGGFVRNPVGRNLPKRLLSEVGIRVSDFQLLTARPKLGEHCEKTQWSYMGVSKNRGTPKGMVYNGKPYWNGWFGGTTIFGNIHIGSRSF